MQKTPSDRSIQDNNSEGTEKVTIPYFFIQIKMLSANVAFADLSNEEFWDTRGYQDSFFGPRPEMH